MKETESWGLCLQCKWWQIEPGAALASATKGWCIDQKIQPFRMRVSGDSGCNLFVEGIPARGAGSGACPPTAKPAR